jgi:asparagine synthase (glutamine-hydrolysing)
VQLEEIAFTDLLPSADRASILPLLEGLSKVARKEIRALQGKKIAVAFSGGIDSSIAAQLLSEEGKKPVLLALGREGSTDIKNVTGLTSEPVKSAELHVQKITIPEIESAAKEISGNVSVSNLAHFEDCISFWLIANRARMIRGVDSILSANGPDELFCGYDRFRRILDISGFGATEKKISLALESAASLGREVRKVVDSFGLKLEEPFLQQEFIEYGLAIPIHYKIFQGNDLLRKRIWRFFGRTLGLDNEIVLRRKKAMQYGMGVHSIVLGLKKRGIISF